MLCTLFAVVGIMSAMPQEADLILSAMQDKTTVRIGTRECTQGTLEGTPVIFSLAGVGKAAAASTATLLIAQFKADTIIFTGVAGGGGATRIGDLVIGTHYLQHDLDLRPIFPQFHIYSLNQQIIEADPQLVREMRAAAERFFAKGVSFPELGIHNPRIHEGSIVSGDQFIATQAQHQAIVESTKKLLPHGFHAIEMEGAAVAQVCTELKVPFVVIRAISDKANDQATVDFPLFIEKVGSRYSYGIVREYFHG